MRIYSTFAFITMCLTTVSCHKLPQTSARRTKNEADLINVRNLRLQLMRKFRQSRVDLRIWKEQLSEDCFVTVHWDETLARTPGSHLKHLLQLQLSLHALETLISRCSNSTSSSSSDTRTSSTFRDYLRHFDEYMRRFAQVHAIPSSSPMTSSLTSRTFYSRCVNHLHDYLNKLLRLNHRKRQKHVEGHDLSQLMVQHFSKCL